MLVAPVLINSNTICGFLAVVVKGVPKKSDLSHVTKIELVEFILLNLKPVFFFCANVSSKVPKAFFG